MPWKAVSPPSERRHLERVNDYAEFLRQPALVIADELRRDDRLLPFPEPGRHHHFE